VDDVRNLLVEERLESRSIRPSRHQQRNARGLAQRPPAFVFRHVQRVFVEQRPHRLDALRDLNRARDIQFVVTVDRDVDIVTHGLARIRESARHVRSCVLWLACSGDGFRTSGGELDERPLRAEPSSRR
jgi:hypothetical protein